MNRADPALASTLPAPPESPEPTLVDPDVYGRPLAERYRVRSVGHVHVVAEIMAPPFEGHYLVLSYDRETGQRYGGYTKTPRYRRAQEIADARRDWGHL